MDLYAKAVNLLEQVATSVHERDNKNPNPLCFSVSEVQVVELWLKSFMRESGISLKDPNCAHEHDGGGFSFINGIWYRKRCVKCGEFFDMALNRQELEKPESGDTNRLFCIQTNNKEVS